MLLRTRANKTQREVGEAVGVTDQTVSNWETGESLPRLTPARMLRLCEVLNCSLVDLAKAFPEGSSRRKKTA